MDTGTNNTAKYKMVEVDSQKLVRAEAVRRLNMHNDIHEYLK